MTDQAECEVIGRWRIVEADQWDREYLDLVEPAFIRFDRDGSGELAFGVVTAGLNLDYARTVVFFTFAGSDEGDEVSGSGSAELTEDGALDIELSFHNGDDAIFKAKRECVLQQPASASHILPTVAAHPAANDLGHGQAI